MGHNYYHHREIDFALENHQPFYVLSFFRSFLGSSSVLKDLSVFERIHNQFASGFKLCSVYVQFKYHIEQKSELRLKRMVDFF